MSRRRLSRKERERRRRLTQAALIAVVIIIAIAIVFLVKGCADIHKYTSIKQGINKGIWPDDFIKEFNKPDTISENTHFNKYGAWLITKGLVNLIKECDNEQVTALKNVIVNSDYKVASPLI